MFQKLKRQRSVLYLVDSSLLVFLSALRNLSYNLLGTLSRRQLQRLEESLLGKEALYCILEHVTLRHESSNHQARQQTWFSIQDWSSQKDECWCSICCWGQSSQQQTTEASKGRMSGEGREQK